MADIFQLDNGKEIYTTLSVVGIPNTGVDVFNQTPPIIRIEDIENKYSGTFQTA